MNGNLDELSTYDFNLTENLLPDDIRHLCLAEDELRRSGSFIRLFPSKYSYTYLPYFAKSFYRNYLLVEWERKYGDRREEGNYFSYFVQSRFTRISRIPRTQIELIIFLFSDRLSSTIMCSKIKFDG